MHLISFIISQFIYNFYYISCKSSIMTLSFDSIVLFGKHHESLFVLMPKNIHYKSLPRRSGALWGPGVQQRFGAHTLSIVLYTICVGKASGSTGHAGLLKYRSFFRPVPGCPVVCSFFPVEEPVPLKFLPRIIK